MTEKKFKNVENECVKTADGREVWLSRSMAVMGIVIVNFRGKNHVLVSERGTGTPDFQGMDNLVCGYLDKQETLYDACLREIFEETSVDIKFLFDEHFRNFDSLHAPNTFNHAFFNNNKQPIVINDKVKPTTRENVTHGFIFKMNLNYLPLLSNRNSEPNEVDNLRWVELNPETFNEIDFAFGHKKRLQQVFDNFLNGDATLTERNRIINSLGGGVRIDLGFYV